MIIMLVWMQCRHESPLLIMHPLMVTLAGLEPATSPAPENKDALSPLELQRRHDLHDRLWRRRGGGIGFYPTTTEQGDARTPLPAALVYRGRGQLLRSADSSPCESAPWRLPHKADLL